MTALSAHRAFRIFHVVLALGMLTTGGFALSHAIHDLGEHGHYAVVAGVQALGALLLLIPRTVVWGGAMLLVVLVPAVIHQLTQADWDPSRLIFAAGVGLVMAERGQERGANGSERAPAGSA